MRRAAQARRIVPSSASRRKCRATSVVRLLAASSRTMARAGSSTRRWGTRRSMAASASRHAIISARRRGLAGARSDAKRRTAKARGRAPPGLPRRRRARRPASEASVRAHEGSGSVSAEKARGPRGTRGLRLGALAGRNRAPDAHPRRDRSTRRERGEGLGDGAASTIRPWSVRIGRHARDIDRAVETEWTRPCPSALPASRSERYTAQARDAEFATWREG